ncbi:MAG: type II secretion system GspH family protein [Aphanocapsa sp. GSE-SYN-MK-11-07L]|jgi:type II secretory pathway pseudopilin PulG|nr:type II secretion system GspH family protein [Aphanocapsa sp. GSE-SYN-MK-11-07L]
MITPKPTLPKLLKFSFLAPNQGFTFVESLAALVVVTITLGLMGPLFMNQRQQNVDSDLLTGATSLATRCMEELRQQDPSSIALGESSSPNPACDLPTDAFTVDNPLGKSFQITTNVRTAVVDTSSTAANGSYTCSTVSSATSGARCLDITISFNGRQIYATQTVYTQLR